MIRNGLRSRWTSLEISQNAPKKKGKKSNGTGGIWVSRVKQSTGKTYGFDASNTRYLFSLPLCPFPPYTKPG